MHDLSEFESKSMLEFDLGLLLAAVRDVLDNPGEFTDWVASLSGLLNKADEALTLWFNKYERELEEIDATKY